jgi:hypothetical protein
MHPKVKMVRRYGFLGRWKSLTVKKVENLFHIDLHIAALDVELNGGVRFLNQTEEVGEHAREKTLQIFVVVVGALHSEGLPTARLTIAKDCAVETI